MKKRILEVINLASSAENFIGDQFSYFPQHGDYEMHLICSDGANLEGLVQKHNIKSKVVQINRSITPWQDFKSLIAICKYIRKNKIDVIICHQEKGNLLGQTAGFLMRVPVRIILSHGILYETMTGIKRELIRLQDKMVSRMSTNVICVSYFVKEKRIKDGVDKPEKSIVLGHGSCNGIDTVNKFNPNLISIEETNRLREKYEINKDDFIIGFCGRLVKDKGIVEMIQAFIELKNKHPERVIKLFVVGGLEQRDALPQEIVSFILSSKDVVFSGSVPYAEIQKFYTLMNVLVLPSHRDGLGLAPLEAQAMSVPAIVSKHTGCRETIVEHETGEYVDLIPESVCEKMEIFLDKEYAKKIGAKGRCFVEKFFDVSIVNENLVKYLNTVTEKLR